jgi:hypothetical protein
MIFGSDAPRSGTVRRSTFDGPLEPRAQQKHDRQRAIAYVEHKSIGAFAPSVVHGSFKQAMRSRKYFLDPTVEQVSRVR